MLMHAHTHTADQSCVTTGTYAHPHLTPCASDRRHTVTRRQHTVLEVPWVLDDTSGLIKGVHTLHLIFLLEKDFLLRSPAWEVVRRRLRPPCARSCFLPKTSALIRMRKKRKKRTQNEFHYAHSISIPGCLVLILSWWCHLNGVWQTSTCLVVPCI